MNRNVLKIIACISMLIDHIGYILLPDVFFLRLLGRIAMPIFAFFIGEGCLYTKNRKKYFLRVFILGLICQAVYVIESLITKSDRWGYMNILLTFSLSIIMCSAYLYAKELCAQEGKGQKLKGYTLWMASFIIIVIVHLLNKNSEALIGTKIEFDYGILGIMLPVFATVSKNKIRKLAYFSLAQIVLACFLYGFNEVFLWALVPLVLLFFYNGQSGRKNLKYFFYLFYPVHLAVLYLIEIIVY